MTYKDRKVFVEDPNNWEIVGELPGVRILELDYGGHAWYKAEILQAMNVKYMVANAEKEVSAHFTEWVEMRKFKYDPEANAFTAPITSAEIIYEIKQIDEESRHIRKKEKKK